MSAAKKKDLNKSVFFTPIKTSSEKKRIYRELVDAQSQIVVKGLSEELYHVFVRRLTSENGLSCLYHPASPTIPSDLPSLSDFIVNFGVKTDKYFFQTDVSPTENGLVLLDGTELFQLQRRKSMRITLPEQLGAEINILRINNQPHFADASILDFSTGGLRISFDSVTMALKLGDSLTLSVRLGKRIPFPIEAEVRYSGKQDDKAVCGLEFVNKTSLIENKLMALQMDMQSEIFRKWNRHQYE